MTAIGSEITHKREPIPVSCQGQSNLLPSKSFRCKRKAKKLVKIALGTRLEKEAIFVNYSGDHVVIMPSVHKMVKYTLKILQRMPQSFTMCLTIL